MSIGLPAYRVTRLDAIGVRTSFAWLALAATLHEGAVAERIRPVLGALGLAALLAVTASLVRAVESLVDRVLVAWIAGAVVLGMVGLAAGACRYFGHDLTIGLHQGDGELASRCVRPGLRASGCWQSSCSCRSS